MTNDTVPPFSFPAVARKKITAAFDGGRITSNGGVMLLAAAERRLGRHPKTDQSVARLRAMEETRPAQLPPRADLIGRVVNERVVIWD